MREFAFAICALLAFLLPVGFYSLILAYINRRSRPLLVSGAWDSAALLFALSGFFLVTLPMLFSEFYVRAYAIGSDNVLTLWTSHWILWVVYFSLMIGGSVLMILWRAHKTMIYNVDVGLFPKVLEMSMVQAGMRADLGKGRLLLSATPPEPSDGTAITAVPPIVPRDTRYAELEIESFASMCHVTLHWDNYSAEVRQQVEGELDKALEAAAPLDNPATGWFLNISGLIFGILFMVVLAILFFIVFARR